MEKTEEILDNDAAPMNGADYGCWVPDRKERLTRWVMKNRQGTAHIEKEYPNEGKKSAGGSLRSNILK